MELTDRDHAILWARQITKEDQFCILDTETTGLDDEAECCSIGIVDNNGEVLYQSLVKPTKPIPTQASQIHGISDDTVINSPNFMEILPALHWFLKNRLVLIYNRDYDQRIIQQSARAVGATRFEPWWLAPTNDKQWHCVMEQFAQFYGDWDEYRGSFRWKKLTIAASYFDLDTQGAHGAVVDCLMTLGVVKGMANTKLSHER